MTHKYRARLPLWIGILAIAATAIAVTLLVGGPAAQARPNAGALAQGYPTPTPAPDLIADKIEVTQAVQDLNNSVRLVQDKRTFVRFHVHSNSGAPVTTARLTAQRGAVTVNLAPVNPGGTIGVRTTPDRNAASHAFLFELPSGMKQGTVTLTALVNPSNNPFELNRANNQVNTNVTFEATPRVNLVLYQISYNIGATTYTPSNAQRDQMVSWLRRAYPLSDLRVWNRTINYGAGAAAAGNLTNPTCGTVNSRLTTAKVLDIIFRWLGWSEVPTSSHYYGMVSDGGGFMRGCAVAIPHSIAAGPTGSATWGWDFDGSYGDWYGGHELAHTYGRFHAMYCDAVGGAIYPYSGGNISPTAGGSTALFGFDIGNQAIYGPTWKDVMTYCANQWVSDFTYESLLTYFKANPVRAADGLIRIAAGDRLLVGGTIDPATGETRLDPIFRVPNIAEITPPSGGNYAIVLRNSANQELARYAFTPAVSEGGASSIPGERAVAYLLINELVPYVNGTTRVEIEGPGAQVIATVAPGSAVPTVTVTAPNGGQTLGGSTVEVTWVAADADAGDALTYMIQYSPDGGQTWMVAAQNVTGNSFSIDSSNLVASSQARFRVWASDGLNTAFDDSDGNNTVPGNTPQLAILGPAGGSTFAFGATVALQGEGYDIDSGPLQGETLQWRSNLDGPLGAGELLSLNSLAAGTHTITLSTPDGKGGFVEQSVQITVLQAGQMPAAPNALAVGPSTIVLDRQSNALTVLVNVDNQNAATALAWTAQATESWLQLSKTSGVTPDSFEVSYVGDLAPGQYNGAILVTSSAGGVAQVEAPVNLTLQMPTIYLPNINKQ